MWGRPPASPHHVRFGQIMPAVLDTTVVVDPDTGALGGYEAGSLALRDVSDGEDRRSDRSVSSGDSSESDVDELEKLQREIDSELTQLDDEIASELEQIDRDVDDAVAEAT